MKSIRIGNGCGFWGDSVDAPLRLVETGNIDYLTLEYLAELTMSILALQKQKDPSRGYAHDFVQQIERLAPSLHNQPKLRIITNAGGMNPVGCANHVRQVLDQSGLANRKIGIVTGDDIFPDIDRLHRDGQALINLDTGEEFNTIRDRLVSANVYLGSHPIVDALQQGSDIVITGRVADASLTVAPAIAEFQWRTDNWHCLSAATVAGHLIECGAQVTGGLWPHWQETDLANVGYPIAIMAENGTFQITKPAGTGGVVNLETVTEQLLYEIGDPKAYLTPDVVADFTTLKLEQTGKDLVTVSNCQGHPATTSYKVSMAFRNGFMSSGTLLIYGNNAAEKAQACGEIILRRLANAGIHFDRSYIECLGAGSCVPIQSPRNDLDEVVLRVAVHDSDRKKVERFTRELAPLVTSGPPGVTGYTGGRPSVREVFAYWPTLIAKDAIIPKVQIL